MGLVGSPIERKRQRWTTVGRGRFFQGLVDWLKPSPDLQRKAERASAEVDGVRNDPNRSSPSAASKGASQDWERIDLVKAEGALDAVGLNGDSEAGSDGQPEGVLVLDPLDATGQGSGDLMHVSEAELQDFLAADHEPVEADPAFKSRLRAQLWDMIQEDELPRQ